jgi:hypothetical protein
MILDLHWSELSFSCIHVLTFLGLGCWRTRQPPKGRACCSLGHKKSVSLVGKPSTSLKRWSFSCLLSFFFPLLVKVRKTLYALHFISSIAQILGAHSIGSLIWWQITVEDLPYHKTCFKCAHGSCTISLSNYASLEGRLYCKHHYSQLFKEKGNYSQLTKTPSLKPTTSNASALNPCPLHPVFFALSFLGNPTRAP